MAAAAGWAVAVVARVILVGEVKAIRAAGGWVQAAEGMAVQAGAGRAGWAEAAGPLVATALPEQALVPAAKRLLALVQAAVPTSHQLLAPQQAEG